MLKFYTTLIFTLLLLPLIPFSHYIACGEGTPFLTHFNYVFGHANILHWAVNSWTLLALHNLIKPHRLAAAYFSAVLASFIPYGSSLILGMSGVTAFFLGFISVHLFRTDKRSFFCTLFLLILGLALPHIAGALHIATFVSGLIYYKLELLIRDIHQYVKS